MKIIRSHANPQFRALLRLGNSGRERRERRVALIEGTHLVAAYLEMRGRPRLLAVGQSAIAEPEIGALVRRADALTLIVLADNLLRELSSVATPPGILAEIDMPSTRIVPRDADFCVMLEDIQDAGNVGSILRSAAAAGASHALLSAGCADAWSPRVLRAAMGAHFLINIVERADLISFARDYGGQVIALSVRAKVSIFEMSLTRPTAFVAGNEGAGISDALSSAVQLHAGIPMPGGAESINVGAAAAVCFFERVRQTRRPQTDEHSE